MTVERAASHSMNDASRTPVAPNPVRPSARARFTPVSEIEHRLFAKLKTREALVDVAAKVTGRKACVPRFSLLRGEVALLAERVLQLGRGTA